MGLLRDIQDDVLSEAPLTGTLRKCLVLSYRLHNAELQAWVERELEGYEAADALPRYRHLPNLIMGNIEGSSGIRRVDTAIPIVHLGDEELFNDLAILRVTDAIAKIECLAMAERGTLQVGLPKETCLALSQQYRYAQVTRAYRLISASDLLGVVDVVRTRILKFACEIELQSPGADDGVEAPADIVTEKVKILIDGLSPDAVERLEDLGAEHVRKKDQALASTTGQKMLRAVGERAAKEIGDDLVSDLVDKIPLRSD